MDNILDYLDDFIERQYKLTGDYPKFIELDEVGKERMKEAIKNSEPILDDCWTDFKNNYRGIKIKKKKG
jgi:hypothetical protein